MFGRDEERAVVRAALSAPGGAAQVVGPPGIGKTTLARAVCEDLGGLWVALGGAAGALAAAARELGVAAEPGAVRAVLDGRALVLDGAEGAIDELSGLVAALGVALLATTRQRAPGLRLVELGPLAEDAAIDLFLERAATVGAADEDPDAVRALVRRLEGWPLAIELAASRARLYGARELLEEAGSVVGGDRLEAALDASWQRLSPDDRLALSRVALFRAPFDRDAFRGVSAFGLDALERLLDASMVRWAAVDGGRRYHLLTPIRTWAGAHLPAGDPAPDRWAEGVLTRAERAASESDTGRAASARAELGRLVPDLTAVRDRGGQFGARAALALAVLARAWGPLRDALDALAALDLSALPEALARAVDRARADLAVRASDGELALRVLQGHPETSEVLRLRGLGELRRRRVEDALALLDRAVREADDHGTPREAAEARYALGVARLQAGLKWPAREVLREALERASGLDLPDLDGLIRKFLALVERDLGLAPEGRRALVEMAVERHVRSGNLRLEVMARNTLAVVAIDADDPDTEAILAALEARALRAGVTTTAGGVRLMRAMRALERQDPDTAELALTDGFHAEGAPYNAAWAHGLLGLVELHRGRRELAVQRVAEAADQLAALGLPTDAGLMRDVLTALGGGPPAPFDPSLPAESPWRVARELAHAVAAGEPVSPALEARARRTQEGRLVLGVALASGGAQVAADGSWFVGADGARVDLSRRKVLARVLAALAAQGGRAIGHEELLALGWPGEQTAGSSGRARVHVAVADLRRLGLRDDLQSVEGGAAYRLRARVVAP